MEPTFLIIGAQRCGTTSTWAYLRQHPGVCVANEKELNFFQNTGAGFQAASQANLDDVWSWYMRQFAHCQDMPCGEASPNYCYYPEAIGNIQADLPNVKIIMILRHPVDRALSHYRWETRMGNETLPMLEAFQHEYARLAGDNRHGFEHYGYVERGKYDDQLSRIYQFFSEGQVLICQFYDLVHTSQSFMDKITGFIGVDSWPGDFTVKWLETEKSSTPEGVEDFLYERLSDQLIVLRDVYGIELERA